MSSNLVSVIEVHTYLQQSALLVMTADLCNIHPVDLRATSEFHQLQQYLRNPVSRHSMEQMIQLRESHRQLRYNKSSMSVPSNFSTYFRQFHLLTQVINPNDTLWDIDRMRKM